MTFMMWIAIVTRNFAIATVAGGACLWVYIWLMPRPGPDPGFGEVVATEAATFPLELVVLGVPTLAMLSLQWFLMPRSRQSRRGRLYAFLLTFWVPVILTNFGRNTFVVVFACIVQVVFCSTLPLPAVRREPRPRSPVW